jgi:hypothetical protein
MGYIEETGETGRVEGFLLLRRYCAGGAPKTRLNAASDS